MKKTFSSKKSAFSLIELSIVLIIIGLLIAGVTGGASLIKSSQLRSVMGEARGYAVAVNAFYSQFNAYPGDFLTPVGASTAGNNNNKIEYYASSGQSESASAWVALRTIGAVDGISSAAPQPATTVPSFGTTAAARAPASKVQSAGWLFDSRDYTEGAAGASGASANQNVVVLTSVVSAASTGNTLTAGTSIANAALLGSDALSIDSKIDDGMANAGKVRGVNPGTSSNCFIQSASTNVPYKTDGTSAACALSYQVDVNT